MTFTMLWQRRLVVLCFGIGCTLLSAGLLPFFVTPAIAQEATEAATPEAPAPEATEIDLMDPGDPNAPIVVANQPTGENGYCVLCHSTPLRTVNLRDGTQLNLYVLPEMIANSVHGDSSTQGKLGCLDCHGAQSFPHNDPTPADGRSYTLDAVSMCTECHTDSAQQLAGGLHQEAITAGNTAAAVCTDCHGAHDVQPALRQPQLVAGVCGDCHGSALSQWQSSAHVSIGPLGCATCHSPHSQRMRIEGDADAVCMNCHKPETMPTLYAHTAHASAQDILCTDCHMHAETVAASEDTSFASHTMLLDTTPCTTCHQNLVDSGEWAEISNRGDAELTAQRDELQARVAELEAEIGEEPDNANAGLISTLQGLLVGLGFGITFAAVFFTRGRREDIVFANTVAPPAAPAAPAAPSSASEKETPHHD